MFGWVNRHGIWAGVCALLLAATLSSSAVSQQSPASNCVVTTAAPSYTNGTIRSLSCETDGDLRTSSTATVSGTVTANQGTAGATPWLVAISPTASSSFAITPVVSTAAESGHVLKNSAGNLYSVDVTSGAVGGYVMVFNATSAPGDGAVTPIKCWALPANASLARDYRDVPVAFSTGITVVFSTTGCFTKTASATAFISGEIQ